MRRKKILITIDWFLPGTKSGGPVRSYTNMLDHLGEFYDFLVITRNTDYCSDSVYEGIQSDAWNVYNDHTSIYYFSKENLSKKKFAALINETDFDILYVNGIYSWFFSILPVVLVNKKHKVIVSARGMLNAQAFSVKKFKKKTFLRAANALNLYKNVYFHATNDDEAAHIKSQVNKFRDVIVAPNLPRRMVHPVTMKQRNKETRHFVNIARVSIEKGTLIMIEAMKSLSQETVLDIYGPIYDASYWEQCQIAIKSLPSYITITYKGILPSEEVPKVLNRYDFFILFSEGENFGHAILEAMSAGCPVLISDQTPWKDLEAKEIGWDVDIRNQKEVVRALNAALSMDDVDYLKWSKAAFDYAEKFTNNPELLEQNKALFLNAQIK